MFIPLLLPVLAFLGGGEVRDVRENRDHLLETTRGVNRSLHQMLYWLHDRRVISAALGATFLGAALALHLLHR